jgi:hypothetical protein
MNQFFILEQRKRENERQKERRLKTKNLLRQGRNKKAAAETKSSHVKAFLSYIRLVLSEMPLFSSSSNFKLSREKRAKEGIKKFRSQVWVLHELAV